MQAINWTNFLLDDRSVKAIFGPSAPTLNRINLHEIILHRDGPTVVMRFDIQEFPVPAPKKWSSSGFNRVQLRLASLGVHLLNIKGLSTNMAADININRKNNFIHICVAGDTIHCEFTADFLLLESISAYRDDSLISR